MFKYSDNDNKVLFKNNGNECAYDMHKMYYTLFIEPVKLFYGFYRDSYDELEKFIWNFVETTDEPWYYPTNQMIVRVFNKLKKELNSFTMTNPFLNINATMANPFLNPAASAYIVVVFDRMITYFKNNTLKSWKSKKGRIYYMIGSECYFSTSNDIRYIGVDDDGKFMKTFRGETRIDDMNLSSIFNTYIK